MENNIFDNLFEQTKNHLDNKRYLYKPKVAEKYTNNDSFGNKKGDIKKDREGNIIYKNGVIPTPHKNVMLSLAFNIAYENYRNIRKPNTKVKELKSIASVSDMLLRYFSNKYYKNIDDIKVENKLIDIQQNYEYAEIERFKQIEYKLYGTIERLRNYHSHYVHEPGILKFEDLFINKGLLSSDDFIEAKEWFYKRFTDTHNHLTQSLKNRKEKLVIDKSKGSESKIDQINKVLKSFEYIKFLNDDDQTLSLNGQLFIACMFLYKRQAKIILDKWRDVKEPVGYENTKQTFFTYYCLSESYSINNFNNDLLKFRDITSKLSTIPYCTNSNLEFIYEKIRTINQETYASIENFENKPVSPIIVHKQKNDSNREFKNQLAAKQNNKQTLIELLKINNKSKFRNELLVIENEILELKSKINQSIQVEQAPVAPITLEALQSKIMPIRKRYILTKVLLQYLIDNNLINDHYKIAIRKTATDIIEYYQKHKDILDKTKNLTYLKNEIKKLEKGSAPRKVLNEHLKELKRNFVFKTPSELKLLNDPEINGEDSSPAIGYSFTLKKKNALVQYTTEIGNTANVTLSSQLLLKWVFIHLTSTSTKIKEKNKGLFIISQFIDDYISSFSKENITSKELANDFFKNHNYAHLKVSVFPKSISNNSNEIVAFSEKKIKDHLNYRVNILEKKFKTNSLQPKPWTYDAKGKIDLIINYMHFCLLDDVFKNESYKLSGVTLEDFMRHNYFNMTTHNIAREYFRYFGRYKNESINKEVQEYSLSVVNALKNEYRICFSFINNEINNAKSLEDLFNAIIKKYVDKLNNITVNFDTYSILQLSNILKINTISNTDNVNAILGKHYAKSFAISPDIISIKKECKNLWDLFESEKTASLNGKPFHCSDYAFIRNYLQNLDKVTTNIDFLFKHIINYDEAGNKYDKINKITVSKELLQLKTEELILWNIAKDYWHKANGEPYIFNEEEKDTTSSNYQSYCTFNKVYNKILDYSIVIDKSFWVHVIGSPDNKIRFKNIYELNLDEFSFNIKVPARKFDNKFLSVETKLIKEYCLWNHFNNETKKVELPLNYIYTNSNNNVKTTHNLQQYEDLMKIIYKELKKSIRDIGLLLSSEKKIIDSNQSKYLDYLKEKYEKNIPISTFYLTLTNNNSSFEYENEVFNEFISIINSNQLNYKVTIEEYLVSFRNFALHYQLQHPKSQKIIFNFLSNFNNYKFAKEAEYHTEEK